MDPLQGSCKYCRQPGSANSYDRSRVLIIQAQINGVLQKALPTSLRARILYLAHFPILAGHPGEKQLYDTLRHEYYCPHMAHAAYSIGPGCQSGAEHGTIACHFKQLPLFSESGPLCISCNVNSSSLPKAKPGNQHVIVLPDRYTS